MQNLLRIIALISLIAAIISFFTFKINYITYILIGIFIGSGFIYQIRAQGRNRK